MSIPVNAVNWLRNSNKPESLSLNSTLNEFEYVSVASLVAFDDVTLRHRVTFAPMQSVVPQSLIVFARHGHENCGLRL